MKYIFCMQSQVKDRQLSLSFPFAVNGFYLALARSVCSPEGALLSAGGFSSNSQQHHRARLPAQHELSHSFISGIVI